MTTFSDFGLKPALQKAIDALGYTTPTEIQTEVRAAAEAGNNIVGQSQTGTGKTTAFLLPLLQKIDPKKRVPQVLIIAPTRELVVQIRDDIMKLTAFLPVRSVCLIGGRRLAFQKEDLRYGPQFVVATPGRLMECIEERILDTSTITHFVLDEVDRMLDMGFIEDIDWIWEQLKNVQQTMTFSATITDEIKRVINKHCAEFVHLRIGTTVTVDAINHTYIDIPHEHKFATLLSILSKHANQKILIFSQTKRNTETITKALNQSKIPALYLNGDLDQRQRTHTLRAFKEGVSKIMVTTDVAARGLNMDNVQLVINFDVPAEPESYVHRIGRTGRAGADGKALMLVSDQEKHLVFDIERTQKIKLKKSPDYEGVTDTQGERTALPLDRPRPAGIKKQRMMHARSSSRPGGRAPFRNSRSAGGSSYGSGSRSFESRGPRSDRPSFGDRSERPARSYESRDRAPRSDDRGSFSRAPRTDAPRRTFSDRAPARSFDSPRSDRPAYDAPRRAYAAKPFDAKPERSRERPTYDTPLGERRAPARRAAPSRMIGGYEPDVVQSNIGRPRIPRQRTDSDSSSRTRSDRPFSDRAPSRDRAPARGGFRSSAPRAGGTRSDSRGPSRSSSASRPTRPAR